MMGWEPGNAYIWTGVFLLHLLLYSSSCPLILLKSSHTLTKREREREEHGRKTDQIPFLWLSCCCCWYTPHCTWLTDNPRRPRKRKRYPHTPAATNPLAILTRLTRYTHTHTLQTDRQTERMRDLISCCNRWRSATYIITCQSHYRLHRLWRVEPWHENYNLRKANRPFRTVVVRKWWKQEKKFKLVQTKTKTKTKTKRRKDDGERKSYRNKFK